MNLHAVLQFDDKTFGILRDIDGELAVDIFERYQDTDCAKREGIASCWLALGNDFQVIRGRPPKDWTPHSPMRENGGRHH